jgi:thiol-disulfide isomerase/thioredoxin
MKLKNFAFALPVILLAACSNTNGFELKGKLNNSHGETVYLQLMAPNGLQSIDSVALNDKGEFTMSPAIKEVGFYRLKTSDKNGITLILDGTQKVTITGDATNLGSTYTVDGSIDSKLFWDINLASTKNYHQRDSLQNAFQAITNSNSMNHKSLDSSNKVIEKKYNDLIAEQNVYLKNLIEKNPTSLASLAAIQQLTPDEYFDTYIQLDKTLSAKYPNSAYVGLFHKDVESKMKLATGAVPPEITMNTPDDKQLSLSSLKGKVVLVDFWASWCGPCRGENPNVVKAYNQYKSKGFEIFSVSLDSDKDKWKQAIQKDNLSWPSHVCDFKGWQSPVVQLYSFKGIPYNVLIGADGKILAKNLRGADLERELEKVFK